LLVACTVLVTACTQAAYFRIAASYGRPLSLVTLAVFSSLEWVS
jgi:hypothetical protein